MLNYNSNQNLLKGLRSSNRLASALSRNWQLKKQVLNYLKVTDKNYINLKDACIDALGKTRVDLLLAKALITKDNKG